MKTKLFIIPMVVFFISLFFLGVSFAESISTGGVHEPAVAAASGGNPSSAAGFAFLGAAISTGLAALGAGIAVAYVGAAAMGAIAERPEIMGKALIFLGLAEGIAIYGLIIAIMILAKV